MPVSDFPPPSTSSGLHAALPAGEHWINTLRDATPVLIRPLRPDDLERERAFLNGLSPQSQRFRFLEEMSEASPALLKRLFDTDTQRNVAFVALVHEDGILREVGISRYGETAVAHTCECAVVVADAWQHRGLGTLLMQHLIETARRNGVQRLYSVDLADNEAMRRLAGELHFVRERDTDDPTLVVHTLDL